jgi:hypothetical protein
LKKRTRLLSLAAAIVLALGGIAPACAESTGPALRPAPEGVVPGTHLPVLETAFRTDPRPSQLPLPAIRLAPPAVQTREPAAPRALGGNPIDLFLIQTFILLHYLDYRESLSVP